jgi:hypothetical protein
MTTRARLSKVTQRLTPKQIVLLMLKEVHVASTPLANA